MIQSLARSIGLKFTSPATLCPLKVKSDVSITTRSVPSWFKAHPIWRSIVSDGYRCNVCANDFTFCCCFCCSRLLVVVGCQFCFVFELFYARKDVSQPNVGDFLKKTTNNVGEYLNSNIWISIDTLRRCKHSNSRQWIFVSSS